jgi:predicted O-methyltransferase YrrM
MEIAESLILVKNRNGVNIVNNKVERSMVGSTVLAEIQDLARSRFLPIIGPVKGKYLEDTVKKSKAKKVLEVGTLIGYSAILIARNLPEDGKLISIEINPQSASSARENLEKANLSDKVQVITGNAIQVISSINERFGMVFLDASKAEYLDYLELAEPKLQKGQPVFADNAKMFASEMKAFLNYVRNSGKYESQFIDLGFDGIEISRKLF